MFTLNRFSLPKSKVEFQNFLQNYLIIKNYCYFIYKHHDQLKIIPNIEIGDSVDPSKNKRWSAYPSQTLLTSMEQILVNSGINRLNSHTVNCKHLLSTKKNGIEFEEMAKIFIAVKSRVN